MGNSLFRLAADAIVLVHVGFVLFVVLGGLLVLRWGRVAWIQVPAAIWGVVIEFGGWTCPLTPLENHLRQRSGAPGYQGQFIEHYVVPLLYPAGLTLRWQIALGAFALSVNIVVYARVLRSRWSRRM